MRLSWQLWAKRLPPHTLSPKRKPVIVESNEKKRTSIKDLKNSSKNIKSILNDCFPSIERLLNFYQINYGDENQAVSRKKGKFGKITVKSESWKAFVNAANDGSIEGLTKASISKCFDLKHAERLVTTSYLEFVSKEHDSGSMLQMLSLENPHTWFDRLPFPREIICHVGPTNSGKTHHAIEILKAENDGVYCAPLRLLAAEMHEKLNSSGSPCLLRTGEVMRDENGQPLDRDSYYEKSSNVGIVSCTVEMLDTQKVYKVAVIDEIQLMADAGRGWAFTAALLSLKAHQIHLCGEAGAVDLIKRILRPLREMVQVKEYKRLSKLSVYPASHEIYSRPQKGDCIIAFSRSRLYELKKIIEKEHRIKCALVYGAMPYDIRIQQADLFNNRNKTGYDVLLATDAIGLGLNLQADCSGNLTPIPIQLAKQIAGRAGRYSSEVQTSGVVLTFQGGSDHMYLEKCMNSPPIKYEKAGVIPTEEHFLSMFVQYPDHSFSQIISLFSVFSKSSKDYFLCNLKSLEFLAELFENYPGLELRDRIKLCTAPIKTEDKIMLSTFKLYLEKMAKKKPCSTMVNLPLLEKKDFLDISFFESLHATLSLYLWLNVRFPDAFPFREKAENDLKMISRIIQDELLFISEGKYIRSESGPVIWKRLLSALKTEKPVIRSPHDINNSDSGLSIDYLLTRIEGGKRKEKENDSNDESAFLEDVEDGDEDGDHGGSAKTSNSFNDDSFSDEYELDQVVMRDMDSYEAQKLDIFYRDCLTQDHAVDNDGTSCNDRAIVETEKEVKVEEDIFESNLTKLYKEGVRLDAKSRAIRKEKFERLFVFEEPKKDDDK